MERSEVYRLIDEERAYQDAKWGTVAQNPHDVWQWIQIAQEELNEAFHAARLARDKRRHIATIEDALGELRQVAAVCIAALEQHGCPPRDIGSQEGRNE